MRRMSITSHPTRTKVLDAALHVLRAKGYSATTVDDVCTASGVGKGSFFHHFKSKEELAIAATQHWSAVTGALFESAPYQQVADPRERILAYIDFRSEIVQGDLADVTCLLGTMVQETFDSHPAIRAACREGIESHARTLTPVIAQAKAQGDSAIATQFITHLRHYVQGLLTPSVSEQAIAQKLSTYIDGYVMVVPQANKAAFIAHVQQCIPIYKEYGALRVFDAWADDLPGAGRINSYGHATQLSESENIVFSWIEWPTKAIRDAAWPHILRDPRMSPDMKPMPFDAKRMLRGGFQTIING